MASKGVKLENQPLGDRVAPVLTPRPAAVLGTDAEIQPRRAQAAQRPDVLVPSWFNTAKLGDAWSGWAKSIHGLRQYASRYASHASVPIASRVPLTILGIGLVAVAAGAMFPKTAVLAIVLACLVVSLAGQLSAVGHPVRHPHPVPAKGTGLALKDPAKGNAKGNAKGKGKGK